jgi:protein SCO1/2
MRRAAGVIGVTLALLACSDAKTKEKPLSEPGEKVYTLTGKILARDGGENTLRLDHEAVPGFMEAMTMDYSVRGASVADLPPDGTRVVTTLHVTNNGYWITGVKRAR